MTTNTPISALDTEKLVRFITQNLWTESIFQYADPDTHIEVRCLLDYISEQTNIPKDQIGKWVEEEQLKKKDK